MCGSHLRYLLLLCSIAIILYMVQKFKTPDFWYPADLQQRARVDEYLSWQHMAIRMHGSKMFWLRVGLLTPVMVSSLLKCRLLPPAFLQSQTDK